MCQNLNILSRNKDEGLREKKYEQISQLISHSLNKLL